MTASPAERLIVALSKEVGDGEVWGLGLGTVLPALAVMLAQRTHAPSTVLYATGSNSYLTRPDRLWLTRSEFETWRAGTAQSQADVLFVQEWNHSFGEFLRPAQIDANANINVTRMPDRDGVGRPIVGGTGIPDMPRDHAPRRLYATAHDRRLFVEQVYFRSGIVDAPADGGPRARLVTDLGVFVFGSEPGMTVESLAVDATIELVRERTGFAVDAPAEIPTTPQPTDDDLHLIREVLDPLGIRMLELVHPRDRDALLRGIFEAERAEMAAGGAR